jgi:hypothetical protein
MSLHQRVHRPWEIDVGAVADAEAVPLRERYEYVPHPVWSAVTGAVGGGFGSASMLGVAQWVAQRTGSQHDFFVLATQAASRLFGARPTPLSGVLFAAGIGAVIGTLMGFLARRADRFVARLLFFVLIVPCLWMFCVAFVLRWAVPSITAPEWLPLIVGSLSYAVCMTLAWPVHVQRAKRSASAQG